jgi:hypothetical protein
VFRTTCGCVAGFGAYVTIVSWGVFSYFSSMVMILQNYTDTAVLGRVQHIVVNVTVGIYIK